MTRTPALRLHLDSVRVDPRAVRVVDPSDMLNFGDKMASRSPKVCSSMSLWSTTIGQQVYDKDHSVASEMRADIAVKEGGREALWVVRHLVSCA